MNTHQASEGFAGGQRLTPQLRAEAARGGQGLEQHRLVEVEGDPRRWLPEVIGREVEHHCAVVGFGQHLDDLSLVAHLLGEEKHQGLRVRAHLVPPSPVLRPQPSTVSAGC